MGRPDSQEQFKFTEELNFFIKAGEKDIAPPQNQIDAQCHPFFRECRAFARLKEVGKEHLAVKCYGYLEFDKTIEKALADQLDLDDWGRDPEVWPEWEEQPLYALVKEFLPHTEFSRRDAPKMVHDLKEIHRCGILVNDLMYDAYVGRQLVDFSFAVTVPHIQFDKRFRFNHSDPVTTYEDFGSLENIFQHWNYLHPSARKITLQADYDLTYNLRSRKEPYEPGDFDWRACANEWTRLPRKSAGRKRRRPAAKTGPKKKSRTGRSLHAVDTRPKCMTPNDSPELIPYIPSSDEAEALEVGAGDEENPETCDYLEFLE